MVHGDGTTITHNNSSHGGEPYLAGAQIHRLDVEKSGAKGENQQVALHKFKVLLIPETEQLADIWILMDESLDLFRSKNILVFGKSMKQFP